VEGWSRWYPETFSQAPGRVDIRDAGRQGRAALDRATGIIGGERHKSCGSSDSHGFPCLTNLHNTLSQQGQRGIPAVLPAPAYSGH
jgi:hypothetical protein